MKNDIDNIFIRYGKLHLIKQKSFGKDSFHAPPTQRGFYAMPIRFQEMFLIGSIDKTQPDQLKISDKYNPDKNPEATWENYNKIRDKKLKNIIHKFKIKNEDFIWHHLTVKNNLIVSTYGSWYKTTVRDWKVALIKESVRLRSESMVSFGYKGPGKNLEQVPKKIGYFSKDHFEIFIDSKIY